MNFSIISKKIMMSKKIFAVAIALAMVALVDALNVVHVMDSVILEKD